MDNQAIQTMFDQLVAAGQHDEARQLLSEVMTAGRKLEEENEYLKRKGSFVFRAPTPKAPELFSGTDGRAPDVRTFIRSCTNFFACFPEMGTATKKEYVVQLLTGPARMWWHQYDLLVAREAAPVIETWEQLRDALLQQFSVFDEAEKARDALDRLKHMSSVAVFNHKFNEQLLRIPPDEYVDAVYKHMYIGKLKDNIQYKVKLAEPETLRKAMEIADRLDRVRTSNGKSDRWEKASEKPRTYAQTAKGSSSSGSQPMELGAIVAHRGNKKQKESDSAKPLTEAQRKYLEENNGCFYCRKANTDHKSWNCPKKQAKAGSSGSSNSRAQ